MNLTSEDPAVDSGLKAVSLLKRHRVVSSLATRCLLSRVFNDR